MRLHFRDLDDLDETSREELIREAWDEYRSCSYADLKALKDALNQRIDALRGDSSVWENTPKGRKVRFLRARDHAVGRLLRWIEERGPDPPKWDRLTWEETLEALEPGDLSDGAEKVLDVVHSYLNGRPDPLLDKMKKTELWEKVQQNGKDEHEDFPKTPGPTLNAALRRQGIPIPSDVRQCLALAKALNQR